MDDGLPESHSGIKRAGRHWHTHHDSLDTDIVTIAHNHAACWTITLRFPYDLVGFLEFTRIGQHVAAS